MFVMPVHPTVLILQRTAFNDGTMASEGPLCVVKLDISVDLNMPLHPLWHYPTQFGFASDRGTDMAIALAHDVSEHFSRRGSPVFTCSLDAQGAFDHIPHSVIFAKLDGVLPNHVWRLLYRWYSSMYVTVRLNGSLGRRLRVERGVRQGSITSPWMFNLVYQELVQRVNELNCGISIGDKRFNSFCNADDLLLASTTITGLQCMIDACTDYAQAHGLNFNASKTTWSINGKPAFTTEPTLVLKGTVLTKENTIKYLGAILGNNGSATHVAHRIKEVVHSCSCKLQACMAADSVPMQ